MVDQRDWVALQRRLMQTLGERSMIAPAGPLTEDEADELADRLTDAAYAMFDLTPREKGVGSAAGKRRWLG